MNLLKNLDIRFNLIMSRNLNIAYDLGLNQSMYCIPKVDMDNIKDNYPVNFKLINTPNTEKIWEIAEIYWGNRIDLKMIERMPKLKWIHFGSVGVNRVNNINKQDLIITSSKGLVTSAMTTNIISLIGIFSRNLSVFFNKKDKQPTSREEFEKYFYTLKNFDEIHVLIIGLGDIGQSLAKKLNLLGVKVDGISRGNKNLEFVNDELSFHQAKNQLHKYDFIISLLPEENSTKDILNYDFFRGFSKNSIFINAGRGSTCNERDLIKSLNEGYPKFAILDVVKNEPISVKEEIYKHPKTFITPHIFAFSPSYWPNEIELFKYNLKCYIEKNYKEMKNIEMCI